MQEIFKILQTTDQFKFNQIVSASQLAVIEFEIPSAASNL